MATSKAKAKTKSVPKEVVVSDEEPKWEEILLDDSDRTQLEKFMTNKALREQELQKLRDEIQKKSAQVHQYIGAITMLDHLIDDLCSTFDDKYGTSDAKYTIDITSWTLKRVE